VLPGNALPGQALAASGENRWAQQSLSTQNMQHGLLGLDIHQINAGHAMLRNQNGLLAPFEIKEKLGSPPLEGSNE
jgi:hypothetical protein